jgi:hypothetical protein
MARVYADINSNMPRSYWDYDSVAISWGVLENYEIVRKIGEAAHHTTQQEDITLTRLQEEESILRSSRASTSSTTRNASSRS